MPTNFPGALDIYTNKVDGVDTVQAAHVNNLQDAVVALQTKLGTNTQQTLAPAGVAVPRSSGIANFALDGSGTGGNINLPASGGQATPFGNASNFSGMILVQELTATGNIALFIGGGIAGMSLVATNDASLFAASDIANRICVIYFGGIVICKNNTVSARTLSIMGFRIRASV